MKRKPKGETIELLYTSPKETNKKNKSNPKKSKKKTSNTKSDTTINLDNEIIIGLTPKKVDNKKQNNKAKGKKAKSNNSENLQKKRKTNSKKQVKRTNNARSTEKKNQNKKQSKKKKIGLKIFKWTSILVLLITAIILFMMSSLFNTKEIIVSNNNKIPSEEIVKLSGLTKGINMFKTSNKSIRNGVKTNSYIENVKIKRNVNGTIQLDVEERIPTYMLKFANAYVYINNQGYMLEISEQPLELPIITGFETPAESIEEGNRLVVEDLRKIEDVIKIMELAKNSSLANMITEINIADSTNYILTIASESKTVQFGSVSNANVKLLKIEAVIEQEKGVEGEIYFHDSDKTVFREETKR